MSRALQHKWEPGQWCCYGDYIHRDDQCKCGCTRRLVVTDDAIELVEFYEKDNSITTHAPPCEKIPEQIQSELFVYVDPEDKSKAARRMRLNNILFLIGETNVFL